MLSGRFGDGVIWPRRVSATWEDSSADGGPEPPESAWCVTKFATHKALKLITRGKLTLNERVVVHRVERVEG